MNYRGVHPERLSVLLEFALSDEELQEFFRTSKKRLILAGEHKLQRLPGNRGEAIKSILRFSDKAQAVLSQWLKKASEEHPAQLVSQLVPRFLAIEEQGVEFDEDEMRELARCGLDNLYSDAPEEKWLHFLASAPPGASSREVTPPSDTSLESDDDLEFSESALETFVAWARGQSPLSAIGDARLLMLARLEEAARNGNETADVIKALPSRFVRLCELLQVPKVVTSGVAPKRGLQAVAPKVRALDPEADYASLQVVATRSGRFGGSSGTYFLDVEGFIEEGHLFALSDDDLKLALPEEGRVILFPDVGISPIVNRPASYEIERFDNNRPIKVRAVAHGRPLYEIVYVPHSSEEHDFVRGWILQTAQKRRNINPVFVTTDGLCIKARVDPLARVEVAGFDWLLDSWPSITAVELRHGTFVLGPIEPSSSRYDCAPVAVSARRLFRSLTDQKAIKVSREQVSAIIDYLRDEGADELKSAHQSRILGKLVSLSRRDEDYDQLIAELMKAPAVLEDIEARKQAAVSDARAGVQKEQKQLQELQRQRQSVEQQLGELKTDFDERVADMRKALRRAFETARNKEAETLADLALWQVLSSNTVTSPPEIVPASVPASHPSPRCEVTELSSTSEVDADVFRSLGIPDDLSDRMAAAARMAADLGLPIVVAGAGASAVGLRVASSFRKAKGTCIDVPIGLISAERLADCFVVGNTDVLLLRNANLSDMCLYAPRLLDQLVNRVLDPPSGRQPVIILSASSGPAALPWPDEIDQLAVKLDLARTPDGYAEKQESKAEPVSPLQKKAWARIDRAGDESERARATADMVQALIRI